MKKFLSVALSLVMLFTATTFNGNAVDGSQMGEPQKVTSAQTRRSRRNVNFKEQKQESTFENFKTKASKALKSTGRAIAGAAKVAGEFVIENAKPIAIVGLGAAGAASTTWVGVNAYKNRENIKAVYNNKEISKKQKTADVLKLLFGIKAKEEPKNDNGNKEQPSNGSNENTANNEKSASQDNEKNGENKEEQQKQKGKLYCATHLGECTDALNAQAEAVAKAKKEAEGNAKNLEDQLNSAKEAKVTAENKANDLQTQLNEAKEAKVTAENKANDLQTQLNEAKEAKGAAESNVQSLQDQLNSAKEAKVTAENKANDLQTQLNEANKNLNICKNDLDKAKKNMNEQ